MNSTERLELSGDLMRGAGEIASFMYGTRRAARKVYYLAEATTAPIFRIGGTVCARRSRLVAWIEAQETAGA